MVVEVRKMEASIGKRQVKRLKVPSIDGSDSAAAFLCGYGRSSMIVWNAKL
jgi:hypothetical protein